MIDFKLDISMQEACTTEDWPIKPGLVLEAYQKTGLTPVRGDWVDFRVGCACALGAMAVHLPKPANFDKRGSVDMFDENDVHVVLAELTLKDDTGGIAFNDQRYDAPTAHWLNTFAHAFDLATVADIEHEVKELIETEAVALATTWEPYEILAWRNALAVRRVLAASGLEPRTPENGA